MTNTAVIFYCRWRTALSPRKRCEVKCRQMISYTWANNGQTYTVSGIYTGNDVNCVAQVLDLSISASTSASIRMDMEWLSSTASTADFQIRLTNTGSIPVKLNALIIRGVHSPKITTGTITWKALNDNTDPSWLGWPKKGTTN